MAWLGTYKYRYRIKIPAGTAGISLPTFAIQLCFRLECGLDDRDRTFIFEVINDDYLKMAVTESDGTTQIYCEVERWDYENKIGLIHVGQTAVTVNDNYFYVYFDDEQADNTAYIGKAGYPVSKNVWDSDYIQVLNFADFDNDPYVIDSVTGNGYPALGSMTTANFIDTPMGRGVTFNGVDDYIRTSAGISNDGTMEGYISIDPESEEGGIFGSTDTISFETWERRIGYEDNKYYVGVRTPDLAEEEIYDLRTEISTVSQLYETWQYAAVSSGGVSMFHLNDYHISIGSAGVIDFYQDQYFIYPVTQTPDNDPAWAKLTAQTYRFSSDERSNLWHKASYLNISDQFTELDAVEFYENIVNGTPFDIVGDLSGPVTFHLLAVHDSEPDLLVPISSYQFRHTSGSEAYLSVVVPDFDTYYQELLGRDGGQLRLHMLTGSMAEFERDNMIIQVDLDADNIKYDEGTQSKPITVEGYGIFGSRYLSLDLPYNTYKNYENESGEWRFRFPRPFYFVRTNDTVTVDGTEITILDMSGSGPGGQLEISDG